MRLTHLGHACLLAEAGGALVVPSLPVASPQAFFNCASRSRLRFSPGLIARRISAYSASSRISSSVATRIGSRSRGYFRFK